MRIQESVDEPHSEGLQLYRERCQAQMPEDVRKGTWMGESDWVRANVPLETMIDVRRQVRKDLVALNDQLNHEGSTTEHPLEDPLYTVVQILALAMPEDWKDDDER